ncbi:AARF domain containing protein kinase [Plakobranchus ocellatus]|uniref:AARF domain containing protein kinase n=1 Tax=Plakobranchus ocellatus TaxID=259542 RepID=A0AAV3Y8H3_9GAST|nr:AARF domain containing protein kinase [Plakobranchus ocellatus]
MEADWALFVEILVQRPVKRSTLFLPSILSQEDLEHMQRMAQSHFDHIMAVLREMPRSMLLVIRNLNTIRAIIKDHGNTVDRYGIMARSAIRGAHQDDPAVRGVHGVLKAWWTRCHYDYCVWREKVTHSLRIMVAIATLRVMQLLGKAPSMEEIKAFAAAEEKRLDRV